MTNNFFPSRIITLYMARMFLVRICAILFALALVLQTLDLLGESGDVLAYPGNSSAQVWTYVSLRLPQIISLFLPFSVLLATVVTLATLNQNSEVVSMKGAGLSAHQVLAPLIVTSMFVALGSFVFNDRIVSRATATLSRWQKVEYAPIPRNVKSQSNVWVRDDNYLIHAETAMGRGAAARLSDVSAYERQNGELIAIIRGDSAIPIASALEIDNATRFDVMSGKVERIGKIRIGSNIQPEQFTLASVDADSLSFSELRSAIIDLKNAGRPTVAIESGLWHKISGPLSSVLMPLLGAVAAFGIARSGRLFFRAVIGMGLGFAYFVGDNFGLAMGNLGAYPPLLAAWGPFLLFLLIGETVLIQTEE